jgi:hypothetical protein
MPRKSVEAMAATLYRTGGKTPAPPAHLSAAGKRLWNSIVRSYPVDYFQPGATELLESFVDAVLMRRFYMDLWERNFEITDHVRSISMLTSTMNSTAMKLRISNSSRLHRHSGMLDEKETRPVDDSNVVLFGGGKTKW